MHDRKHISRDHYLASPLAHAARTYSEHMLRGRYLLLCDVTEDTENTASSIIACWTLFTELLPGNTLITIYASQFVFKIVRPPANVNFRF
jgi:hypothetical protein